MLYLNTVNVLDRTVHQRLVRCNGEATPMLQRLLDVDEALVYLRERGVKITKQSLYTQICRVRKPRVLKIGRSLRFTTDDLDDYIRSITRER